jgi:peptidoglycan/LPS O-acetylase OafA/YrhL
MLKILSSAERAAVAAPAAGSITGVNAKQSQVIPSLDGFRAISVLIVVVAHAGIEAVPGGLGVTVFFFLSGYLISTLMLDEYEKTGRIDIPKFYARRVFRLMPPLLITLAIACALTWAGLDSGGITAAGIASQLLYFANYYIIFFDPGNTIPDGTGVLWSLAVEEHFYIFYPLFLTLLLGNASAVRLRTIAVLLGIVCIAVLAWRIHLAHPGFRWERTYFASDTRIDSIIYGCILAILKNPVRDLYRAGAASADTMSAGQWALLAAAVGLLLLTLVYRDVTFRETYRYSLQGLALMPIFYFAVRFSGNPLFRHLNSPLAVTLGTYSYAIYLIHLVIVWTITTNAPAIAATPYMVLPAVLLVSVAYAAVIDRFVDPYFKQLRHLYRTTDFDRSPRDSKRGRGQPSERQESQQIAAE